jgi:hypothetical protein
VQGRGAGDGDGPRESRHPSEADLAGFLDGDLAAAERRRVVSHLDECAACRRELVEMRQMVDSYSGAREAAAATAPPRGRRRGWRVGFATALAAAGIASLLLVRRPAVAPSDVNRVREAPMLGQAAGNARIAVVSPPESATISPQGAKFTWRSTGADLYRFALLTETGEPVWSHETSDTTVSMPAAVEVRAGESYFWRVDAIADGISATTGVRTFRASR